MSKQAPGQTPGMTDKLGAPAGVGLGPSHRRIAPDALDRHFGYKTIQKTQFKCTKELHASAIFDAITVQEFAAWAPVQTMAGISSHP